MKPLRHDAPDRSAKLYCWTSVGSNDDIPSALFTIFVEQADFVLKGLTIYSAEGWVHTMINLSRRFYNLGILFECTVVVSFRHLFRALCILAIGKWSFQFWMGYPTFLRCVSIRLRTSRDCANFLISYLKCRSSCYFGVSIGRCYIRVFGKNSYYYNSADLNYIDWYKFK